MRDATPVFIDFRRKAFILFFMIPVRLWPMSFVNKLEMLHD